MRRRFLFVLVIAGGLLFVVSPVDAKSPQRPSQGSGGLHVCCGGTVGYVGGSGSISGNVVGPGGGGAAIEPAAVADAKPNAATNGSLSPAIQVPDTDNESTPARSTTSVPFVPLVAGLGVLLLFLIARMRRGPRAATH